MNIFLLLVLGLIAVAIPAARVMAVKNGADKWDYTQKCNLYNLGWVAGVFAVYLFVCIVVSVPWWVGFILLAPVLALCIWSLIAAYDWDVSNSFGARMNEVGYGDGSIAAAKFRLKIRRYVGLGILGFLLISWISIVIAGALDNGSTPQAQPPATTSPTTQAPATTTPTTPATTSPAPSPSDSTSATASSKRNCMDDIPVDAAVKEGYLTTLGNTLDVCRAGKDWANIPTKSGTQVQVLKWVKDSTYEYDLIAFDNGKGKQVWIRVPLP